MSIAEPSTTISDYILAAACFVFAARARACVSLPSRLWVLTLFATGMAALLGGTYHAIHLNMPPLAARVLWTATLLAIGVAGFGFASGAAAAALREGVARSVRMILTLKLVVFALMIAIKPLFGTAVADYGVAAVIAAVLAGARFKRDRAEWARWVLIAIVVAGVAALFLLVPFGRRGYFDERDVYHVVQIGAMYAIYRAALAAEAK